MLDKPNVMCSLLIKLISLILSRRDSSWIAMQLKFAISKVKKCFEDLIFPLVPHQIIR